MAAVWRVPAVRTLVGVVGSQYVLVGALDVLYVVLAITTLGIGESGAGYLNAAFGAGGVIGVAVTAALVARRRLAPALVAGIVAAALALGPARRLPDGGRRVRAARRRGRRAARSST